MSTGAKVTSIDAVKEFRIALIKFQESATMALGDCDSDVNRTTSWLEGSQLNYWTSQIRKRQEILAEAEDKLRFKKLYKDATGRRPSAVEEQKAVDLAKKRLAEAHEKFSQTKSWIRRMPR